MSKNLMLFTGNANPSLAGNVAGQLGEKIGQAEVKKFSDGEVSVEIQENVRGKDVFVILRISGSACEAFSSIHLFFRKLVK